MHRGTCYMKRNLLCTVARHFTVLRTERLGRRDTACPELQSSKCSVLQCTVTLCAALIPQLVRTAMMVRPTNQNFVPSNVRRINVDCFVLPPLHFRLCVFLLCQVCNSNIIYCFYVV
jgi:hypothetical protein